MKVISDNYWRTKANIEINNQNVVKYIRSLTIGELRPHKGG